MFKFNKNNLKEKLLLGITRHFLENTFDEKSFENHIFSKEIDNNILFR